MGVGTDANEERKDAARDLAEQFLREARRLGAKIESLLALDVVTFQEAIAGLDEIVAALKSRANAVDFAPRGDAERPMEGGNVESFILEIIRISPEGASVENIFNSIIEAGFDLSREALTVRLHRMARAGKITRPSQGHYAQSTNVTPLRPASR